MTTILIAVSISKYIKILNHHVVHLKTNIGELSIKNKLKF